MFAAISAPPSASAATARAPPMTVLPSTLLYEGMETKLKMGSRSTGSWNGSDCCVSERSASASTARASAASTLAISSRS